MEIGMEIGVLGPLTARVGGVSVVPSAGKPRQILAALALSPGEAVTVPALMDEIWGDEPPRSASSTLQTYIAQLRRHLDAALEREGRAAENAKDMLVHRHGGYFLDISAECVDVARFERLVRSGREAWAAGDRWGASAGFAEALAVWRGPALVDVRAGRLVETQLLRLDEMRLGALENRIAADLDLGRHAELLGELAALAGRYPTYENFHAMYMLALHRVGRTCDAIEAFRRLRAVLVEELGVEPTRQVQRLLQSILAADPQLSRPRMGDRLVG
ncbi:BTAD domain-containing putative transcriptional regulator [Microbispora sp. NPDC049125]|uniref:AfsR/SARP family transcriptional regulator n=1 Tax=Microbispora sp. NPDC049125 TaxID=3154929 RepID=UPI0034664D01